jgi:hypothetical protein
MKDNAIEFFKLPLEKKKAVGTINADGGLQGFGHHFNTSTGKLDWAECLILLGVQPIQNRNMDFWPTDPPSFRYTYAQHIYIHTRVYVVLPVFMPLPVAGIYLTSTPWR